jgi:hypothetical protein
MGHFQRAAANAHHHRIGPNAKLALDWIDERDLQHPRYNQSFGTLDDAGQAGKHGDQFCFYELDYRPSTILPPRDSLTKNAPVNDKSD